LDSTPVSASLAAALAAASFLLPPLLDGVERKIRAAIHSRIGPPLTQTWFDILKLWSKEAKLPRGAELAGLTVLIGLSIALALAATLSTFAAFGLVGVGPVVAVMVMVFALHSISMATGCASSNPFATIGSFRRVFLNVVNEVGLALSVALALVSRWFIPSWKGWALLGISTGMMLVACFCASGRLPYDIHEAEPELASGTVIELSGPLLAAELYSHLIERWVLAALPFYVSLAPFLPSAWARCLALVLGSSGLWTLFAVTSATLGRSRADLALRSLGAIYTASTIAWVGVWLA